MNCKDLKTEGDHDWTHHSTTLMAFVPPIGEPSNDQQVRTVEYVCRRMDKAWDYRQNASRQEKEQCGATKTVIIKVGKGE